MAFAERINPPMNSLTAKLLGNSYAEPIMPKTPKLGMNDIEFADEIRDLHRSNAKFNDVVSVISSLPNINVPVAKERAQRLWSEMNIMKAKSDEKITVPAKTESKTEPEIKIKQSPYLDTSKFYTTPDRPVKIAEDDLSEVRNILFGEISNRNLDRQEFEARIILNTMLNRLALDKAGEVSLREIATQPGQYQAYGSEEYKKIAENRAGAEYKNKLAAIDKVLEELRAGTLKDTTGGKYSYHHDPEGRIWYTEVKNPRIHQKKFYND